MALYYKQKTVVVVNHSTCLTDAVVQAQVNAIQRQVNEHFGPVWGIFSKVLFMNDDGLKRMKSAPMVVYVVDVPTEAGLDGVLGYHTETDKGQPVSYIFAKLDLDNNLSPAVTLSHEVLEMLGDPTTSTCSSVFAADNSITLYAFEACDAVEDDSQAYDIDGVKVSNFIYPDWFDPSRVGVQYDFKSVCKNALEITGGGYSSVFRIGKDKEWTEITAQHVGGQKIPTKRLDLKKQYRPTLTRSYKRNQILLKQKEILK